MDALLPTLAVDASLPRLVTVAGGCDEETGDKSGAALGPLSAEFVPLVVVDPVAAGDGVSGSRYGALAYTVVPAEKVQQL